MLGKENLNLVIAGTTVGDKVIYSSSENLANFELEDERKIGSNKISIANPELPTSIYFSVQIIENFRIYSLYDSNVSDGLGRDGYIGYHIFLNKKYRISNFISVLNSIHSEYGRKNMMCVALSEELLSKAVVQKIDENLIVVKPDTAIKGYILFSSGMESVIEEQFNSLKPEILSKLYAFNKKNFQDTIANQQGFKNINNENLYHTYKVSADAGFIRKIEVGGKPIPSDKFENRMSFTIVVPSGKGSVVAIDKKRKEHHLKAIGENSIRRPIEPIYPGPTSEPEPLSFGWGSFAVGILLGIILGVGGFWAYGKYINKPKIIPERSVLVNNNSHNNNNNTEKIDKDSLNKNMISVNPDQLEIDKYKPEPFKGNYYFYVRKGIDSLKEFRFGLDDSKVILYENQRILKENPSSYVKVHKDSLADYFSEKGINISKEDWQKIIGKFAEKFQEIKKESEQKMEEQTERGKKGATQKPGEAKTQKSNSSDQNTSEDSQDKIKKAIMDQT